MARRASISTAAFALTLALTGEAAATPQFSAGLTTGAAWTDMRARSGFNVAYHLGARADMLVLRERANTMAIGPYVDVATAAFDTFETGGGLEWLIPWDPLESTCRHASLSIL